MINKEVFKPIPEYEGIYEISNLGRVKSFKCNREKILKPTNIDTGFKIVSLWKDGRKKIKKIHQLVALVFLNHKTIEGSSVRRIIGKNNMLSNLIIINKPINKSPTMKVLIKYKDTTEHDSENKDIRYVEIESKGNKFRIDFSPTYGLVINKINLDGKGKDIISIQPRTTNEIIIK